MTERLRRKWRHLAVRTKTWLALALLIFSVAFTGALALDEAYIPWGDSRYLGTNDDIVDSNFPAWLGSAFKIGSGVWATNVPAWYVAPDNSNEAALEVLFNPSLLSNSLIMKMGYLDSSNASLSLDLLLMTNQAVMTSNLLENILTGSGADTSRTFTVPLTATNTIGLQFRRGFGAIMIRDSLLSPDSDGDGYSDTEESIWGSDPGSALSVPSAAITGQVFYAGVQSGVIHVLAATNASDWASAYYLTLSLPTASHLASFMLPGLPLRHPYYARAWRDVNDNQAKDYWEPSGVAVPYSISLNSSTGGVVIVMVDPDTDGDGMTDADELALGMDPLTSNTYARLPYVEAFETNTVHMGDINGQNNWRATPAGLACIQTNTVYEGAQALSITAQDSLATVSQLFAVTNAQVVWVDAYLRALASSAPTGDITGSAVMYFDTTGTLNVYDGASESTHKWVKMTNATPCGATGAWVRVTTKMDYSTQRWLVCVRGVLAAEGLGFASPVSQFSMVSIAGRQGGMDSLSISTNQPAGLSLDGDPMSDDWEWAHFGNLDQNETGDPDHDGVNNLSEFLHGTDPTASDSDHDGLSDVWEITHGFNPTNASDAALDADSDGLSNLAEYEAGTDPWSANTCAHLPFIEQFETNTVQLGDINGQNNWSATPPGTVVVQSDRVYEGAQALEFRPASASANVSQLFVVTNTPAVWVDTFVQAFPATAPAAAPQGSAVFYFNTNGYLNAYDGLSTSSNKWVSLTDVPSCGTTGAWVRLTTKMDYNTQRWLICVNGIMAGEGLGFASPLSQFTKVAVDSRKGALDAFSVTTNQPAGLSLNGMPVDHFRVNQAWSNIPEGSDPDASGPARAMGRDAFSTIQSALNVASNGATITIAPGLYPERLSIIRSVTLEGSVVSDPVNGILPQVIIQPNDLSAAGALMEIGAVDDSGAGSPRVIFRDIDLSGSVTYLANPYPYVGFNIHRGASVLLSRCHQTHVRPLYTGWQTGWGVVTYDADLDIEDCYFEEFNKAALSAFGNGTVNVRRSKFRGLDLLSNYWFSFSQCVLVYQDNVGGVIDDNVFLNVGPSGKFNTLYGGANISSGGGLGLCLLLKSASTELTAHSNLFINCQGLSRDDRLMAHAPAFTAERFIAQGNRTDNGRWVCLGPYNEATSIYGFCPEDPNMPNYAVCRVNPALFSRGVVTFAGGFTYTPTWYMPNPTTPVTLEAIGGVARLVLPNTELPYYVIAGTNVEIELRPKVTLVAPASCASFAVGAPIPIEATVSGASTWSNVSLYADGIQLASFTNAPFAFVWTNAPQGSHNLRVVLTDAQAREVTSPTVPVSVGTPAAVLWECWKGVNGSSLDVILNDTRYPNMPDERVYLSQFEGPRDLDMEYGARYRAILTAPQTGTYTFYIMADDLGSVWLGTNASPASARQILSSSMDVYGVWNGGTTVQLNAGERYYIEALHKQVFTVSHFAVGWRLPDGTFERPIPGNRLEPYTALAKVIVPLKARNLYTLPANAMDMDGDGLSDVEEATVSLTAPQMPNTLTTVQTIDGSNTAERIGNWTTNSPAISALRQAGSLDYTLDLPANDQYRVAVEYAEDNLNPYNVSLDLTFSVDGEYVGRSDIPVTPGQYQTTAVYTPWLAAGTHTFRIRWWNVYPRKSLKVKSLKVIRIAGPDANANGRPDWVEARMSSVCSADVLPPTSQVSPLCAEGLGAYRSMMSLSAGGVTNAILPGTDQRWYANVPLNPDATTPVALSFQNGGYALTQTVEWTRVNVCAGQALTLRRGDSLRLSAFGGNIPTGSVVNLTIGTNSLQTGSESAAVFQFNQVGDNVVCATVNGLTNQMTVTVVEAGQPKNPDLWLNQTRYWVWNNLPTQATVEGGSLRLVPSGYSGSNAQYLVTAMDEEEPGALVARLGTAGPILAHAQPVIFNLYSSVLGYVQVVEVNPDGSSTTENSLYLSRVPADLDILLTINTGGAIFGNGSLEYYLSRADFDDLGAMSYRVNRPPGKSTSCHWIFVQQDGISVGPML